MYEYVLIFLTIFSSYSGIFKTPAVQKQLTYTINQPVRVLVQRAMDQMDNPDKADIPPHLIDLVKAPDLHIKADVYPKQGYYKFSVQLLKPHGRVSTLTKQIEFWNKGDVTVVRATAFVQARQSKFPFRWVNGIKNRVTNGIEDEVLNYEKQKLLEFAR